MYEFKADLKTGEKVAIKKVKMVNQEEEGISGSIIKECSILKKLNHENIIAVKDTFYNG